MPEIVRSQALLGTARSRCSASRGEERQTRDFAAASRGEAELRGNAVPSRAWDRCREFTLNLHSESLMRSFLSRLACVAVVFGLALSARAIEPKYLPPNAEMAITVNLKQILASELFKDKKDLVDEVKGLLKGKLEDTPVKE